MMQIRYGALMDYPAIAAFDEFIGDRRLDLQAGQLTVADFESQTAIGYAAVDPTHFLGWPLLSRLCVASEVRKQGVGQGLLEAVVRDPRFIRLYTTTEVSNVVMHRLILKVGGTEIGHADSLNFNDEREVLYRLK